MSAVLDGEPSEIHLFTLDHAASRVLDVSEEFAALLGRPVSELNGLRLVELVLDEDQVRMTEQLAAIRSVNRVMSHCRFTQSNGQALYVEWVAQPLGDTGRWRVDGTETADLTKLLADRRDLKTRLALAVGHTTVATWDLELDADRFHWEPQAAAVLGVAPDQMPATGEEFVHTVHPDDRDALRGALARLGEVGTADVGVRVGKDHTLRYLSLRGRVLSPGSDDPATRAVGLLLDITTEKALEEQLLRMSVSDGLTGIPNRRGFDQTLRGEWRRCTRAGESISILMIDVDHFKQFNDSHGHMLGDQALIAISRALKTPLGGDGASLARYGGEEFVVVLPGADPAYTEQLAHRCLAAVRAVTLRQVPEARFSVSVGAATWRPDDDKCKAVDLLARADRALYLAKTSGRDRAQSENTTAAAHAA